MNLVFVLGTGRCGSSLVHEVLAKHPDVGFISNVDDLLARLRPRGRANARLYRHVPYRLTAKGRPRFAPSEGYRILDREVSPLISQTRRDLTAADAFPWLAERMYGAIAERATAQGSRTFIHKFTGWPRAGFLSAIFPDARFVHIVRDGRAVANSFLQMPWWTGLRGPDSWTLGPLPQPYADEWESTGRALPALAAIAWKILIDAHESAAAPLQHRWLTIRYEDMIADPRREFSTLLHFAGLPLVRSFERAVDRRNISLARRSAYQQELGQRNVAMLDRILKEHLERYRYSVGALEYAGG